MIMKVGIPKEIKNHEYRAPLTTQGVRELCVHGHEVFVEKDAGIHIGITNDHYQASGAQLLSTKAELYAAAELIVKVKEPQLEELAFMQDGQAIFSYLHLAVEPELTAGLLKKQVAGIAFETITGVGHPLPLLFPMSEVAGKLSIQAGAAYLEKARGGRGILLGGAVGTRPAVVMILGGGSAGTAAAEVALGMGAEVVIFEKNLEQMRILTQRLSGRVKILYPAMDALETTIRQTDLLVGGVLIPGAAAPKLISRALVKQMPRGAVIVDIAIDQGGCIETSRPTTHADPVYVDEGVLHYCVTNMPGAVPLTSSYALENAILQYLLRLADQGVKKALAADVHLRAGLNVYRGKVTHQGVAASLQQPWTDPVTLLAS